MISLDFRSNLALYMVGLIEQKQALGYKYEEQVKLLKKFDAFCFEYFPDEKTVTKAMLDIWAVKKSYESWDATRPGDCGISFSTSYGGAWT